MKKTLVILAGPPATGKTYFSNLLKEEIGYFPILSPDTLQEMYSDEYGFQNISEKINIYDKSWNTFYDFIRYFMSVSEKLIVIDYPFSYKQREVLYKISTKYKYEIITVRFQANFDTLYERRKQRDLSSNWHYSHLVDKYMPNDNRLPHDRSSLIIKKIDFEKKIKESNYNEFSLGTLYCIDTTNFDNELNSRIRLIIKKIRLKIT